MAKANKSQHSTQPDLNGVTVTHEDGSTETMNPKPALQAHGSKKEALAKQKAEIAEQKAAKAAAKAEDADQKAAAAAAKKEVAEKAKVDRQERLASLGRAYTGPMLALADAVKSGKYVKSSIGQLRSTSPLAEALDGVTPNGVIQTAKEMLNLEHNPYSHLNVGQQSMNLRNKMRGAITKGTLTIEAVVGYVAANNLDVSGEYKAKALARAEAKAARAVEVAVESTEAVA